MFSCIKDFVARHKKKIIVVGVVIGSAVVGHKFAQQRFIEWQENETKEFLERTRKQQYFESSEKTCNQTILYLSTTLRENILELVNCEDVIKNLREGVGNKVLLWKQLTFLVFTKVSLLIYAGTLIVIALRIQLNIIGGHIFCKTVWSSPSSEEVTGDLQEKYLEKCHYLLNKGVKELYPLIQEKVGSALQDVTLKQNLSLQQVENILWAIQSSINDDPRCPLRNMPQLLFGPDSVEQGEDPFIKEIMLDTIDLLKSAEVVNIASSCVSRGFSNLIDKIADFFLPQEIVSSSPDSLMASKKIGSPNFTHPNHILKPLAKIVPIVNGFGNPGLFDLHEEWIFPFVYLDKVKMLGANIYESYSCLKV